MIIDERTDIQYDRALLKVSPPVLRNNDAGDAPADRDYTEQELQLRIENVSTGRLKDVRVIVECLGDNGKFLGSDEDAHFDDFPSGDHWIATVFMEIPIKARSARIRITSRRRTPMDSPYFHIGVALAAIAAFIAVRFI